MHVTQAANFRKTKPGALNYTRAASNTSIDLNSFKDLEKAEHGTVNEKGERTRDATYNHISSSDHQATYYNQR
jgi:hypothetical protein